MVILKWGLAIFVSFHFKNKTNLQYLYSLVIIISMRQHLPPSFQVKYIKIAVL
jgi:hypothetical protein